DRRITVEGGYELDGPAQVSFRIGPYDKSRALVIDPVLFGYSTYLGGTDQDVATSVKVDASGNAYVAGWTYSSGFQTSNPAQAALAGSSDVFVLKINAAGNALVYSTYLGGSDYEEAVGIAIDGSGNAYVAGGTISTDFPTVNPVQAAMAGPSDAFV